ncbi:putative alpha-1,6-mannanase (GH76 family) [Saccharothrix coeruleofusca]|uniref:glycoside hydrolase family 76 protein n=1 Tax=Saccharothrix coeruleofusca TaxID=33919 RepID=UPI001AEA0A83|nr:glycoside hydrolase family 76 protein [Saccharothrix coeruleofusca]MBP2337545.1 putative alpha-1,6-mannanase (GH76 family) [Saccharothrix coeruleofusca]
MKSSLVLVSAVATLLATAPPATAQSPTGTTPSASTTPSAAATVCNRYCDARDPALAPADRDGGSATLFGRRISLRFNDTDAMGWATIGSGLPGDEVWLDRSFDGGRSWASGARLGNTAIPSGAAGWRTMMYNVDDWANRGVGALRACGRAGNRPDIACTAWARTTWNAYDRRTAAATALMQFYDNGTGLFTTSGWWNSANALTAIVDNIRVSGMASYRYAIANTYDRNVNAAMGHFRNDYLDDTGWWGLAWVAAYDLTRDSRYLSTARHAADHMHAHWDGVCGGGVWWRTAHDYKNAITNALYIQLNAALHNRISGDTAYLQRARAGWSWYSGTGMINSANLVNDGISLDTCRNNGSQVWSYNQGVVLAALVELNRATGDAALLTRARQLAAASTTAQALHANGVLREPCEPANCEPDGPSFKGIYARSLGVLNRVLADRPYTAYLTRQANTAHAANRTALDTYGLRWAGPFDRADAARQHSALDLMNAA